VKERKRQFDTRRTTEEGPSPLTISGTQEKEGNDMASSLPLTFHRPEGKEKKKTITSRTVEGEGSGTFGTLPIMGVALKE